MSHAPAGWYRDYFDRTFLRVYGALLTAERTAAEVDAIRELLRLPAGARLLDVGCGWGRHSIELARSGFEVTGVDLSPLLLEEAERLAAAAGVGVRWLHADMRRLDFHGEFDAALSLFSSLGYFGGDAGDLRVLRGIRRAVRPGGLLLLDTMHRDLIAREFVERDWWETPDGGLVRVEREFDAFAGVSHETLHWRSRGGREQEKARSVRVRSATEWKTLLDRSRWRDVEWFGGWDLEPFSLASARLVALARAR
jgi:cyclopropane fatty-acyl-phospholipid synthase-like methyltransferase